MQKIVKVSWSPEQYVEKELERAISRPAVCASCGKSGALEAHGYYRRWVSSMGEIGRLIQIRVRRFFAATAGAP